MNQIYGHINHPLPINTKIKATKPRCQCKGGGVDTIIGDIKKVITNQTGHWYYLNIGSTVSAAWVQEIL